MKIVITIDVDSERVHEINNIIDDIKMIEGIEDIGGKSIENYIGIDFKLKNMV